MVKKVIIAVILSVLFVFVIMIVLFSAISFATRF